MADRDKWDELCGWLTGNPTFRLQLASHKQALGDHMGYSQETADPRNKARRTDPPKEAGSSSTAAGSSWHSKPPPRPSPSGWSTGGGSSVDLIRSLPTQQQPPCRATSAMRWVTLVTFSIGLVATVALQRTHLLYHSCLAQANQAPTQQCRPPRSL